MTIMSPTTPTNSALGAVLVAAAALTWSFGGAIARYLSVTDSWTIIFWRALFAAAFLLCFMLVRDGPRGTVALFRGMGWPGIGVGLCFATASSAFIVALQHTSVANILVIQAAVPLVAALLSVIVLREPVRPTVWVAILAVIGGIAVMVSGSLSGRLSLFGDGLAVLIAIVFASAVVITRRYAGVRMAPAGCSGMLLSAIVAASLASGFTVGPVDLGLLFAFGALNLGLGLALFTTGARLVAAPLAALIATLETVLGPLWVWLLHGETAGPRTLIGGAIVMAALLANIVSEWRLARRVG